MKKYKNCQKIVLVLEFEIVVGKQEDLVGFLDSLDYVEMQFVN